MRGLAVLALTVPFGGPQPARPEPWTETSVLGLTLAMGPARNGIGLGGLTRTMPVRAAGGEGEATVRQGLTRDVSVTLREANAADLTGLFDLPAWMARWFAGGRVGLVELKITGDRFELTASKFRIKGDPVSRVEATGNLKDKTVAVKAYALGGLLTYEGRLPGE
jgi:hypothetical protein